MKLPEIPAHILNKYPSWIPRDVAVILSYGLAALIALFALRIFFWLFGIVASALGALIVTAVFVFLCHSAYVHLFKNKDTDPK